MATSHIARSASLFVGFLALLPHLGAHGDLSAQVIEGRLIDTRSEEPLDGAMVSLLDTSEQVVANTLTDALGRFILKAPLPGTYSLRADRIGFASAFSDPIPVQQGDTVLHRMQARFEPVSLEGIAVEGRRRCTVRPAEGMATARVWDEPRKALSAASWTERETGYRYRILSLDRQLGPNARRVEREGRRRISGFARNPITSRPADVLVEQGVAQQLEDGDWMYFAPDASALLSDPFLDSHCMTLRRGEDDRAGLLGLEFRPVEGRRTPDIAGILWLDPETSELQRLDYRYVNLERYLDGVSLNDHVGGIVICRGLPNGAWIVQEWRIRMPLVARQGRPGEYIRTTSLTGLHEIGGIVTRVYETDGDRPIFGARTGTVIGSVADSTGLAPLEGARVYVAGTPDTATSDPSGLFAFSGLSDGVYRISFTHPYLDSLAHRPAPEPTEVRSGETRSVTLEAPSTGEVLAHHCSNQGGFDPGDGVAMFGRFVRAGNGTPVSDAILEILFQQDEIQGQVNLYAVPSEFGRRHGDRGRMGWHATQHTPTQGRGPSQYWRVRYTDYGIQVWPDGNGFYVVCRVPTVLPLKLVA